MLVLIRWLRKRSISQTDLKYFNTIQLHNEVNQADKTNDTLYNGMGVTQHNRAKRFVGGYGDKCVELDPVIMNITKHKGEGPYYLDGNSIKVSIYYKVFTFYLPNIKCSILKLM